MNRFTILLACAAVTVAAHAEVKVLERSDKKNTRVDNRRRRRLHSVGGRGSINR